MKSGSEGKTCKKLFTFIVLFVSYSNGQETATVTEISNSSWSTESEGNYSYYQESVTISDVNDNYSSSIELEDNGNENSTSHILKFATFCESPNFEAVYCVEISKCQVLNSVKHKKKYAEFVEASRCGPKNENKNNFKVCCGKYNNFRNITKSTVIDAPKTTFPSDLNVLPKKCGTQKLIMRGRIVGGTDAALGEYPWMARILHKNSIGLQSYGCAGFLIHPRYVVTAAHCIHSEFSRARGPPYSVVLGEHNTTTDIDCTKGGTCAPPLQKSRIFQIIVHEGYSNTSKNHYNDIAIIQVNKRIQLTDYIQPICLLSSDNVYVKKYFISGWGKTEKDEYSTVKMKVDLLPFDKDQCITKMNLLNLDIADTQICAGGEKLKDSCNGDSGGPLMIYNGTNYFAAGLVSYGIGCGMPGWPGVYTSVPHYVDWIKRQMVTANTKSAKIRKERKKNKKKLTTPSTIT